MNSKQLQRASMLTATTNGCWWPSFDCKLSLCTQFKKGTYSQGQAATQNPFLLLEPTSYEFPSVIKLSPLFVLCLSNPLKAKCLRAGKGKLKRKPQNCVSLSSNSNLMNLIVFHLELRTKFSNTKLDSWVGWGWEYEKHLKTVKDEILSQTVLHCKIECYVELVISFLHDEIENF